MNRVSKCIVNQEKGMVMVATLLLMASLTIIGFASIMSSSIEIQLAGNDRKTNVAFQYAEAGIQRAGDLVLPFYPFTGTTPYTATNANLIDPTDPNLWHGDVDGDGIQDVNLIVSDALPTDPARMMVQAQGIGPNNASSTIEVILVYNQGTGGGYAGEGGPGAMNQGNFQ